MAYNYADSKGWTALGPSIGGAHYLLQYLNKNVDAANYPEMYKLLTTGSTNSPELLKGEATRLAAKTEDKDVKDTLLKMARAAAKSKDFVMTTD
jgi:hypothetical protein